MCGVCKELKTSLYLKDFFVNCKVIFTIPPIQVQNHLKIENHFTTLCACLCMYVGDAQLSNIFPFIFLLVYFFCVCVFPFACTYFCAVKLLFFFFNQIYSPKMFNVIIALNHCIHCVFFFLLVIM